MDKLLLAERDTSLREGLVDLLRRQYDITTCTDGRTCLELLETLRPKVAIIDLALTELEGLYVIEQSLDFQPPVLLCVTDFSNDYVTQTLQDLGVYVMVAITAISGYTYLKDNFAIFKDGFSSGKKGE